MTAVRGGLRTIRAGSVAEMGVVLLVGVAVAGVLMGVVLQRSGGGTDWRWLRYPLVLMLVLFAGLAATTAPWPDGLGLNECTEVVNPALEGDPAAEPQVLTTCSDLGASAASVLLAMLVIVLLVSPEMSEFSVPGFLELKKQAKKQATSIEELRLKVLKVETTAMASAAATGNRVVINQSFGDAIAHASEGELGRDEAAILGVAYLLENALLDKVSSELEVVHTDLPDTAAPASVLVRARCSIYVFDENEKMLRQLGSDSGVADFAPGKGAVGQAYARNELILVAGDDVHNETYGLDIDQQRMFADDNCVGAIPVRSAAHHGVLGVLSAVGSLGTLDDEAWVSERKEQWSRTLQDYAPLVAAYLEVFDPSGNEPIQ